LNWLLKYLKARQVKDQFDNGFISVPRVPGHQHFSKPYYSKKCGTWQGKVIHGMIRTLEANHAPILIWSKDDMKTQAGRASDEIVIGAVLGIK